MKNKTTYNLIMEFILNYEKNSDFRIYCESKGISKTSSPREMKTAKIFWQRNNFTWKLIDTK